MDKKEAFKEFLRAHPKITEYFEKLFMEKINVCA